MIPGLPGILITEEDLEAERQRQLQAGAIWPMSNPVGTETTATLTPRTWWDDTKDALWRGVTDPGELLKFGVGVNPAGNAVLAGRDIGEGAIDATRALLRGDIEGTRPGALQIGLGIGSIAPIVGPGIRKAAPEIREGVAALRAAAKDAARAAEPPPASTVARALPDAPVARPGGLIEQPRLDIPQAPATPVAALEQRLSGPVEGVPVPEPPPPVAMPPPAAAARSAIDLPDLPEGLLFDPAKGAEASKGATLGMTPEQYAEYLNYRAGLLDPGIAKLNRPSGAKGGREGTNAGLPSLRAMTVDDAITTAKGEPHLIRNADDTGYVGAPHTVRTPEQLQAARDRFDASVARGGPGSDWYIRVKAYVDEVAGRDPVLARQLAEELALFSAQSDPFTNLGFAQQARMGRVRDPANPPTKVRTGQQAERFNQARSLQEQAIEAGVGYPNMQEGNKTGIFRQHMDPTAPAGTTGTNDIWHARAFGFVDPKTGKPWDKALSQENHAWLDYETMLAVDRANAKKLGGRSDWTPAEIQAAPWVAEKAASLEKRFKIAADEAFGRASSTYPDYAPHFTMQVPGEQKPGGNTRLGYGTLSSGEFQEASRRVDPSGLDPMYRNLGMSQRGVATDATGAWREAPSKPVEYNPVDISQPMIDFRGSGNKREINPDTLAGMRASLAIRGANDFQIGSPGTLWDTRAGSNSRTSIKIGLGRVVTEDEARRLNALGEQHGLVFANTADGAGFLNFGEENGRKIQKKLDVGLAKAIDDIVPGAKIERADATSPGTQTYVDYGNRMAYRNRGKGQTIRMLDKELQAAEPRAPGMVAGLMDDPNEAVKAQQNLQRLALSGQIGIRPDYERWLRLVSEGRLRAALEQARAVGYRGLPAVAGGAVLGGGLLGGDGSREPGA